MTIEFFLDELKRLDGVTDGYIILLDNGKCEFSKYDITSSQTLYSGIYVVGEDIGGEKINIKCTSENLQVALFGNKDKYLEYHKSNRFTVGEESDAIEKYSDSTAFVYTDDSTFANLEPGMIMIIEDGVGEYSIDEGPVIN